MTLPGPALPPIVQLAMYSADPLGTLERWSRQHGETFRAQFAGVGDFVFTSSPADIRTIFSASPDVLEAGPENAGLAPVVGSSSLLVLDGAEHIRHRRLVMPVVHGERLPQLAQLVRACATDAIVRWPVGRPIELAGRLEQLTLAVTIRALFSTDALARPFEKLLRAFASPVIPLLAYWGIDIVKRMPWLAAARRKAELDRALYAEIARRRAGHAQDHHDGLAMLLSARDANGQPLDDRELRDELVSLVVAGHETVSGALAWAIELLLDHPAAMTRAQTDADYLDAAIKESLRLRPVLALVARKARVPFTFRGEVLAPGTWLAPSIHLTHRRADLYPEPGVFRPERFLGIKPDPYQWLPFGGGGRRCIGMGFALLELKMILTEILARVRLRSLRAGPAKIQRRNITLVPAGRVPVVCALP
jgi:cytochrome P450 family 135